MKLQFEITEICRQLGPVTKMEKLHEWVFQQIEIKTNSSYEVAETRSHQRCKVQVKMQNRECGSQLTEEREAMEKEIQ